MNKKISMNDSSKNDPGESMTYQIRIKGHLGHQWTGWFEEASILLEENGETLISCTMLDQAALYGLLKKVRDLAMPLISINRVNSDQEI